jgi:hypothetical protein
VISSVSSWIMLFITAGALVTIGLIMGFTAHDFIADLLEKEGLDEDDD